MGAITTGMYTEATGYEFAEYSPAVPAVIYQQRGPGIIRVERQGKGGHLTLIRHQGVWQIVVPGRGVVGFLGYSHSADSYCVEQTGRLDFDADYGWRAPGVTVAFRDTFADAVGEAGLYWLL